MDLKKLQILIAEDDPDDGEYICESFFSNNLFIERVKWVKNGRELLDFLIKTSAKKPDVILTDINIPIVNGIEALEEIAKHPHLSLIPVFVYSSSVNPIHEKNVGNLDR